MVFHITEFYKNDDGKINWELTNKYGCSYVVDEPTYARAKAHAKENAPLTADVIVKRNWWINLTK